MTTFEMSRSAMPRRMRLINWHGHENATLEINGAMLAIIGDNGSGKSLILDAIDWALFPAPNKQFNAAAREGGRQSRRTLSNTILFFDPHGIDRPDKGWRRGRTVGYCALEIEHDGASHWIYGSAAAATPHSASPWYYALPASMDQVTFLADTGNGRAPLQYQEFKKANEWLINQGGEIFPASAVEEYNRTVARRLLNIDGSDWQRRYDALYDVLHRVLGLRVDDALVADPSSVVRQFLPVVDRPHLERLVEGLEGIQRIHRDIEEYEKLMTTMGQIVEARRKYHTTVTQHGALAWLRAAWADDDRTKALETAEISLAEARAASAKAETDEEAAYIEEASARRELEALQQLHQGEIVQAVSRANAGLQVAIREQERAARDLKQADQRLVRSEQVVTASLAALNQEKQSTQARIADLRSRARAALGVLPDNLDTLFARLGEMPNEESTGDQLHSTATELDRKLAGLEEQVQRLQQARAAVNSARQAERDALASHTAHESAAQRTRQSLWQRWERLRNRWPHNVSPAPTGDPALTLLAPLEETARRELELSLKAASEASANATRLTLHNDELLKEMAQVDAELARPAAEVRPRLSKERERAQQQILAVDRDAMPLFWHLDFRSDAGEYIEAIEGLLAHADVLTAMRLSVPLESIRGALAGQTDWHLLQAALPPSIGTRVQKSVASVLDTKEPVVRSLLDGLFNACALVSDPTPSGDYLCADGRYRLGAIEGQIPLATRTQQLIGAQRRKQAAAERRAELLGERDSLLKSSENTQIQIKAERAAAAEAEEHVRRLEESLHLLEEVRGRLTESQDTQSAHEETAQAVANAQRTLAEATVIEHEQSEQWKAAVGNYSTLTDPSKLPIARQALSQAVADALNRAFEARGRLSQLQQRLRAAEETRAAEAEAFGAARAHVAQADRDVDEAQRLLTAARGSLRAAGLDNVEAQMTELQQRLRAAQEIARQRGVAKGVALHQLEAAQQRFDTAQNEAKVAGQQLTERNQHFAALLTAVTDSLELSSATIEDPARYARQLTRGRDSRSRLEDDLPRVFAAAERDQEAFLASIGEYQSMVGQDDKFGLRQPNKTALVLAPQGYLMDVVPRREGTRDIRLLQEFLQLSIEQLKQTLTERVTKVVRDIILGEVVSHLVEQLARAQDIIVGLNERLANARFFARNTRFSLKLTVRLARHPDIPFDHVAVASALIEHGRNMPSPVRADLTKIFSTWLDEQMRGQAQPSVEAIVEQLDYRRWVDISLLHEDELDPRVRPWDSAVSGFGSGGEQRVPVYVLLITAAAMQFAVSNAPLRLLMHDEAFARMDQRNADLVVRFAQQLGVGLVIASPNLDLFAEGIKYATAYRLRQLPNGLIAREALHLRAAEEEQDAEPVVSSRTAEG
jgi:energy-coupling factor transporter ATP-binding protein EcfA2